MLKYYSLMLPACQVLRGLLCLPLCLLSRLLQRERERVQGAKRERERRVDTVGCHPSNKNKRERERERGASTTWSTSSFTSYHGQLLSLAVQWGVAIEIERAIKKNASF